MQLFNLWQVTKSRRLLTCCGLFLAQNEFPSRSISKIYSLLLRLQPAKNTSTGSESDPFFSVTLMYFFLVRGWGCHLTGMSLASRFSPLCLVSADKQAQTPLFCRFYVYQQTARPHSPPWYTRHLNKQTLPVHLVKKNPGQALLTQQMYHDFRGGKKCVVLTFHTFKKKMFYSYHTNLSHIMWPDTNLHPQTKLMIKMNLSTGLKGRKIHDFPMKRI